MYEKPKSEFEKLKGTAKGRLIAVLLILLAITGLLLLIVYVIPDICLTSLLIPLAIFGIQYLFGEREMKRFIIVGLLLILVTGLIFGLLLAHQYNSYNPPPLEGRTPDGTLTLRDGKVTPRTGSGTMDFNFTVTYIDPVGPNLTDPVSVHVEGPTLAYNETRVMYPVDNSTNSTVDGKAYYCEITLAEGLYYHEFQTRNSSGYWANTSFEQGPVSLSLSQFLLVGFLTLPYLALMYFVFVMMYWWIQKAKSMQPSLPPAKKADEFTCSKCGADVPADATKCSKCGEEFEEDEEEKGAEKGIEKTCKVCNENIKKDDLVLGCKCGTTYHVRCARKVMKCPNCGREFKELAEKNGKRQ